MFRLQNRNDRERAAVKGSEFRTPILLARRIAILKPSIQSFNEVKNLKERLVSAVLLEMKGSL
jgi:hypothetical protein